MKKAVSLFSGAGGMDIGFESAGIKPVLCVEIDSACCETLRLNMPEVDIWEIDVSKVTGEQILGRIGIKKGELDVLYGGPPCQSFSLAGKRGGLNDDRGKLVFEFVRLVHELSPKAFVMENVKGMANWGKGEVIEKIEDEFTNPPKSSRKFGNYKVQHKVLNAVDFGVSQSRERIFIIGNRLGKTIKFPAPTHGIDGSPFKTVRDAIGALPPADPPSKTALRVSGTIKERIVNHGY